VIGDFVMQAVTFQEHGNEDVLQIEDVNTPTPGDDEVLVAVEAASINWSDIFYRRGAGFFRPDSYPSIPGSDFAGLVEGTGENVEEFDAGDRVFGTGMGGKKRGTYSEYVTVPIDNVARLPADVTFDEGAGIGTVGLAAWQSVIEHGDISPAETCLVHGGSGGLGHIAVQLADTAGGRVVTTAGSKQRREQLIELGADVALDYAVDDLRDPIEKEVPSGIDVIVDPYLDKYLDVDLSVVSPFGRISALGLSDGGEATTLSSRQVAMANGKEVSIQFSATSNVSSVRKTLDILGELLSTGRVSVTVAETYPLSGANTAHQQLADGSYVGKIILRP
jgi:NADPH2:quinone reductase